MKALVSDFRRLRSVREKRFLCRSEETAFRCQRAHTSFRTVKVSRQRNIYCRDGWGTGGGTCCAFCGDFLGCVGGRVFSRNFQTVWASVVFHLIKCKSITLTNCSGHHFVQCAKMTYVYIKTMSKNWSLKINVLCIKMATSHSWKCILDQTHQITYWLFYLTSIHPFSIQLVLIRVEGEMEPRWVQFGQKTGYCIPWTVCQSIAGNRDKQDSCSHSHIDSLRLQFTK